MSAGGLLEFPAFSGQLFFRLIGLQPQQPEEGAQRAFQFANAEVEELAKSEGREMHLPGPAECVQGAGGDGLR